MIIVRKDGCVVIIRFFLTFYLRNGQIPYISIGIYIHKYIDIRKFTVYPYIYIYIKNTV